MNKDELKRQNFLIEILLDSTASVAERHDAAIDLLDEEEFENDEVLNALIKVGSNPQEEYMILDICGESIGNFWTKRNLFDIKLYNSLPKWTQNGLYCIIESRRPNWIKDHNLDPPFKGISKRKM